MKKAKNYLLLALCSLISCVSLTSCLDGDDGPTGIDPALYKATLSKMYGRYTNKIYFYNDTVDLKDGSYTIDKYMNDSITSSDVAVDLDTTIIIRQVPGRVFSRFITDDIDLRHAIDEAEPQPIRCKFDFYNINTAGEAGYYVAPISVTYNVEVNGQEHEIQVAFATPSIGYYYNDNTQFQVFPYAIFKDGEKLKDIYNQYASDTELAKMMMIFLAKKA